jgi:hypothetical protein
MSKGHQYLRRMVSGSAHQRQSQVMPISITSQ